MTKIFNTLTECLIGFNFDAKAGKIIFFGYSLQRKAYRVFNRRTLCVKESVHVVCDETNSFV